MNIVAPSIASDISDQRIAHTIAGTNPPVATAMFCASVGREESNAERYISVPQVVERIEHALNSQKTQEELS